MRTFYYLTLLAAVMIVSSLSLPAQIKDAAWIHGGNETTVLDVVFTPDSRYVATTLGEGSIRIWDVNNGNLVRLIPTANVISIDFTPTGDTVAGGTADGMIKLWRVSTGQLIRSFPAHTGKINSVSYGPDGRYLASGGTDTDVKLWDTWDGTLVKTMSGHTGGVNEVDFSSDGLAIASASDDFRAILWNRISGDTIRTFKWRNFVAFGVGLYYQGERMVVPSGGCPGNAPGCGVSIFNTTTGALVGSSGPHVLDVIAVAYAPDGNFAASGARDGRVYVYQPKVAGLSPRLAYRHDANVNAVTFSPNSLYLASGSEDKTIRIYNLQTGKGRTLVSTGQDVTGIALSRTNPMTAFGGDDLGKMMAWRAANDTLLEQNAQAGPLLGVAPVAGQPDEVLSGGIDGKVRRWKLSSTVPQIRQIDSFATGAPITSIANIGTQIVTGHSAPETGVKIWDPLLGTQVTTLNGNGSGVRGVAGSPDGVYVASAGEDNVVRVWDRTTGAVKLTLTDHTSPVNAVAFSPDGKYLASASDDRTVRVYQFPSGAAAGTYTAHSGSATGVAFTPDSKFLVSSSEDKTVRVWKIETGDNVYTYNSYPYPQLSVDAAGQYILSGTGDGMMVLWDLKTSGGNQLAAPQLRLPADNAADINPKVTFEWDATAGAETYKLQVSTNPNLAADIVVDESDLSDTSRQVTTLTANTTYYWRVKGIGSGGESPWSQVWSFTTNNGGPSMPSPVAPANGATGQPLDVTLRWNTSAGATYYQLEVADRSATYEDGSFKSVVRSATITPPPSPADTFYVLTGLDKGLTYYWHVRAQNTTAPSAWSPAWNFKTDAGSGSVDAVSGVMKAGFVLAEVVPNPATTESVVRFVTPKRGHVRLSVIDGQGKEVAVLVDRLLEAGEQSARFDATRFAAGTYFTRLEADGVVLTAKVVVTR